jgi:hypothetical protein
VVNTTGIRRCQTHSPFSGPQAGGGRLLYVTLKQLYHTLILVGVQDWYQLFFASSTRLSVREVHRGRIWHGQLPSRYRIASPINVKTPLIVPLANLGFEHDDVRVITDENPWDLPTAENIVRRLFETSFVLLNFIQRRAMAALVYDAQPNDSLVLYCT